MLIDGCPVDEPVQSRDHRGAFAGGVVGRAVQRVGQEHLRSPRLRDHLIQLGDLLTHDLAPLRTGSAEGLSPSRSAAWPIGMWSMMSFDFEPP